MEPWWVFTFWGLFGGIAIDGLQIWQIVKEKKGRWPAEYRRLAFFIAELIRLGIGAGLATAFGLSGEINGPLGATMVGIATPMLLEKLVGQAMVIGENQ